MLDLDSPALAEERGQGSHVGVRGIGCGGEEGFRGAVDEVEGCVAGEGVGVRGREVREGEGGGEGLEEGFVDGVGEVGEVCEFVGVRCEFGGKGLGFGVDGVAFYLFIEKVSLVGEGIGRGGAQTSNICWFSSGVKYSAEIV